MFILSFMENKNVWCYIMLLGKDAKIPLFCAKLCDVYVQFVDFNFESKTIHPSGNTSLISNFSITILGYGA